MGALHTRAQRRRGRLFGRVHGVCSNRVRRNDAALATLWITRQAARGLPRGATNRGLPETES